MPLPVTTAASDDAHIEAMLDALGREDWDAFAALCPPEPKPEPSWVHRYAKRRDLSQTPVEFLAAERAKVSANQNTTNSAQAQAAQAVERNSFSSTLVAPSPSSEHSPKPSSSSTSSAVSVGTSKTTCLHVPANQNLPAWERLSPHDTLIAIGKAAEAAGAISITVMTSARREASLRRAAAAGRDLRQIIADEIARQFRKRHLGVPPMLFNIEVAPVTKRVHIHGYYVPADETSSYFGLVREIFKHALGYIPGQAGSTQFGAEPLYTPERWLSYFQKASRRTSTNLGVDKLLYVGNSMRRLAKAAHEATRRTITPNPIVAAPAPAAVSTTKTSRSATTSIRSRFFDSGKLAGEHERVLAVSDWSLINAHRRASLSIWLPSARAQAPPCPASLSSSDSQQEGLSDDLDDKTRSPRPAGSPLQDAG